MRGGGGGAVGMDDGEDGGIEGGAWLGAREEGGEDLRGD